VPSLGIHHVAINVEDVPAAIDFYTTRLGLTVRTDRPDFGAQMGGAWLDAGGQQVHLIEGTRPDGKGPHFALQISGLDDLVTGLRAEGFSVSDPFSVGADRISFVSDPAGNPVELHEVGTATG
jgi:catechol 2,3-dioxygenase-like lactoylglutathione lyase family enzyme